MYITQQPQVKLFYIKYVFIFILLSLILFVLFKDFCLRMKYYRKQKKKKEIQPYFVNKTKYIHFLSQNINKTNNTIKKARCFLKKLFLNNIFFYILLYLIITRFLGYKNYCAGLVLHNIYTIFCCYC